MQVTTSAPLTLSEPAQQKRKSSNKNQESDASSAHPELMETFTQASREQQAQHLRAEHLAQMRAQDLLHKGRINALFEQLHTTLFTIWNEVWQQRQKSHDQAFKEWLKLLTA